MEEFHPTREKTLAVNENAQSLQINGMMFAQPTIDYEKAHFLIWLNIDFFIISLY